MPRAIDVLPSVCLSPLKLFKKYVAPLSSYVIFKEDVMSRKRLDKEVCKRMIREMGLKVTWQRLAILASLASEGVHVTAQEVFESIKKKHPEIGFATVYRFLRRMTEKEVVTEVRVGGLPARYELTPLRHHDHMTCTQCGKIVEFENEQIEALQEQVAKGHHFRLTGHVLELYGICLACDVRQEND